MNVINKKYHSLDNFADIFRNAKPFPHIALDDFLDEDFFASLKKLFHQYSSDKKEGKLFNSNAENNKWISLNSKLPNEIYVILESLNDKLWISNLLELEFLKTFSKLFSTSSKDIFISGVLIKPNESYILIS